MINKEFFGKLRNGEFVEAFTLENANGMKSVILNYGGILKELWVPDQNGVLGNVVLSYDDLMDYVYNPSFMGAIIGRTAGRIEGGILEIDGVSFTLSMNDKFNMLHGGSSGFHQKLMNATCEEHELYSRVILRFKSFNGEGGFPGALEVEIIYTMLKYENTLKLEMRAKSNQKTYLNMSSHSYFNLSNHVCRTVEGQTLEICADAYAPVDDDMIPRRGWKDVDGTVFDFRKEKLLDLAIHSNDVQIRDNHGIDHPFRLIDQCMEVEKRPAAKLFDKESGRLMKVYTSQPHMVIYMGNFLDDGKVHSGRRFKKHQGICFEAQEVPNAPKFKGYQCNYLEEGQEYKHSIIYQFDIEIE